MEHRAAGLDPEDAPGEEQDRREEAERGDKLESDGSSTRCRYLGPGEHSNCEGDACEN